MMKQNIFFRLFSFAVIMLASANLVTYGQGFNTTWSEEERPQETAVMAY